MQAPRGANRASSAHEGAQSIPFERALEFLTVEEAWTLLVRRRADIAEKKNELQIMVGSRYIELIESADAIVAMRDTAAEVAELLAAFPRHCNAVLEEAAAAVADGASDQPTAVNQLSESLRGPDHESNSTRLLLNAPSSIWSALDVGRHLDAAILLLQCRAAVGGGSLRGPAAPFLRSQWAYVEQLTPRIIVGAKRVLQRPAAAGGPGRARCAESLAAVLLVHPEEQGGASTTATAGLTAALELFLRIRGRFVEAALRGDVGLGGAIGEEEEQQRRRSSKRPSASQRTAAAGGHAGGKNLQRSLCASVAAIQETIVDIYVMFARQSPSLAGENGNTGRGQQPADLASLVREGLARAAAPRPNVQAEKLLPASAAAHLCTKWLALLLPKLRRCSRALLRGIGDAAALAQAREALWTLTQPESEAQEALWREACTYAVDVALLNSLLLRDNSKTQASAGRLAPPSHLPLPPPHQQQQPQQLEPGEPLKLWPLAFSGTFAELAEGLLHGSLERAVARVRRQLRDAAVAACGPASAMVEWPSLEDSGRGGNEGETENDPTNDLRIAFAPASGSDARRMPADQIVAAADRVALLLSSQLQRLSRDAWSLVQHGDSAAAAALAASIYLHSVEATGRIAVYMRETLEMLIAGAQRAAAASQTTAGAAAFAANGNYSADAAALGLAPNGRTKSVDSVMATNAAAAAMAGPAAAGRLADAAVLVGRVAWLLLGRRGRALRRVLKPPPAVLQRPLDRIGVDQLEAAFEIADTDGDGVVEAQEAEEALAAISVAAAASPGAKHSAHDAWGCRSLTLAEFTLLSTALLDEQRPHRRLRDCLEHMVSAALSAWAQRALAAPAADLAAAEARIAADAAGGSSGGGGSSSGSEMEGALAARRDEAWRRRHGLWERCTIELSAAADDGLGGGPAASTVQEEIWLPVVVSPHIMSLLQCAAAEVCRFASTADLAGAASAAPPLPAAAGAADNSSSAATPDMLGQARAAAAERVTAELVGLQERQCVGPNAPAQRACEAMRLQCLLDCLFLEQWLPAAGASASGGVAAAEDALLAELDPINLQIYMPHLRNAARANGDACRVFLSALFPNAGGAASAGAAAAAGPGTTAAGNGQRLRHDDSRLPGGATNLMALAPRAQRFGLLPVPLQQPPLQQQQALSPWSGGAAAGGQAADGAAGAAAAAGGAGLGLRASLKGAAGGGIGGGQALADTVRTMLHEQATQPLSNILGAASSFLGGGRQRK